MRTWLVRSALATGVTAVGAGLYVLLGPYGLEWVAYVFGALVVASIGAELLLRMRRTRAEAAAQERWRLAIDDAAARPAALSEVRRAIDGARRLGTRGRVRHARLAMLGAELALAGGDAKAAVTLLGKVEVDALAPLEATIVRHARAQAHLYAGHVDDAAVVLSACPPVGHPFVDASIALQRAALRLQTGDFPAAAMAIEEARRAGDSELRAEADLLAAIAEKRPADRDPEIANRLARFGPPVVREYLAAQDLSTPLDARRL